MANPAKYPMKENTVYKIATNVTAAYINRHRTLGRDKEYIVTYRTNGGGAPSATEVKNEGVIMFQDHPEQEKITSSSGVDIYALCNKEDGKSGNGFLIVWA